MGRYPGRCAVCAVEAREHRPDESAAQAARHLLALVPTLGHTYCTYAFKLTARLEHSGSFLKI